MGRLFSSMYGIAAFVSAKDSALILCTYSTWELVCSHLLPPQNKYRKSAGTHSVTILWGMVEHVQQWHRCSWHRCRQRLVEKSVSRVARQKICGNSVSDHSVEDGRARAAVASLQLASLQAAVG